MAGAIPEMGEIIERIWGGILHCHVWWHRVFFRMGAQTLWLKKMMRTDAFGHGALREWRAMALFGMILGGKTRFSGRICLQCIQWRGGFLLNRRQESAAIVTDSCEDVSGEECEESGGCRSIQLFLGQKSARKSAKKELKCLWWF